MAHAHVRRGDLVEVIKGRNKAPRDKPPTRGKVLRVLPDAGRVLVEKVNMIKKHQRPTQKLRQGGIIEREGLFSLSNVLLVCSRCDRPARAGTKILADGRKTRVCRRCGESIDKG
jgi:large subunit ribosomal protein L24